MPVTDSVARVNFGDFTKGPWSLTQFSAVTQVTDPVSIRLTQARQYPMGPIGPARLTVVVDDPNAVWDPSNPSGANYDQIVPDCGIELRCSKNSWSTSARLMWGYLSDAVPSFDGFSRRTTLTARDGLGVFATYDFDDEGTIFNQYEFTGERAERVFNRVAWPAGMRGTIEDGTVLVPPETATGNALAYLQDLARTEAGILYITANNDIAFYERNAHLTKTEWSVSQATFGAEGVASSIEIIEATLTAGIGRFNKTNQVTTSGHTGKVFTYGTAPAEFPPTSREQRNLKGYFDADSYAAARWWKDAWNYSRGNLEKVVVQVYPDNLGALTAVADGDIKLLNRVTVKVTPPGHPAQRTYDCIIEGIEHDITYTRWLMTLTLSPYAGLPDGVEWLAWGDAFTSVDEPAW